MNNNDELDPEINPAKGVKRLNKIPMVMVIGLAAFAALVIMFGIISHSNKNRRGGDETKDVTMDDEAVDMITAQIPEGDIRPTSKVIYRDGAEGSGGGGDSDSAALAALTARLDALEQDYAAQSEELRQAKEAEKLAVADAPLVVNINDFRQRYSLGKSGGGKNASQLDIAMGRAPVDEPLLLPPLDGEGEGLEEITEKDLIEANGAVNAYRKRAEDGKVILPYKVQEAVADLELKAGSTIPITMLSGINSDLPGDIIAQVNSNVFDTKLGDYLLIPQGTRMFGTYESDNVLGVDRVAVVWNRLIFPNGESLSIEEMRGADTEGYSGLKDKVNNHYGRIFGSALMLSTVGTGIAVAGDTGQQGQGQNLSAQQAAANEVSVNLGRVITEKLKADINIEPTIEIRPGMKSVIVVAKDLTFERPYEQHVDYEKLGHPITEPEPSYFDPRKGTASTIQTSTK